MFPKFLHNNLEINFIIMEDFNIKTLVLESKTCFYMLPKYKTKSSIVYVNK